MVNNFNKKAISHNFSNAAKSYNDYAQIQKTAAQHLIELAQPFLENNPKILDLGSGTGFVSDEISQKYSIFETDLAFNMLKKSSHLGSSHLEKFKIQSDFENLPFKKEIFDVLTSSFSLQWTENFTENFNQFAKILKNNGIFAFALPTQNSLSELKAANLFNFNQLPSVAEIKLSIKSSPFKEILFKEETLQQNFTSGIDAIRSIKKIGANYTNSHSNYSQNKIIKSTIKQFNNFCLKNFSRDNKNIQVSWDISYFILQKIKND